MRIYPLYKKKKKKKKKKKRERKKKKKKKKKKKITHLGLAKTGLNSGVVLFFEWS